MNKTIKYLLLAALAVSAQNLDAHTNKTFMQPRNQALVNLPLEQTTFAERVGSKMEDRFGGHFQVTGFYGASVNKANTGKYFGVNNLDKFDAVTNVINGPAINAASGGKSTVTTVDPSYIVHQSVTVVGEGVSMKFAPESIHYGVDMVYHQDLSKIVNGLYLKVNLPVERVENDAKLTIAQANAAAVGVGATLTQANFVNYFKGAYEQPVANANAQAKLTKGKYDGKRSATGVADIDVQLGYNFLKKETYHAGINIGMSIPTGNEVTGEYMFAPTYGSKHFGLGGGITADARVWGDADHNFKLNFAANYRYLFAASETRYTGLAGYTISNMSQYYLLAKLTGANANLQQLTPAANVLNQNFDVTPGSQLDGILGLAYNKGGFNIDLGYNMFFKEAESLKVKAGIAAGTWHIASRGMAMDTAQIVGSNNNGVFLDNNNATAGVAQAVAAQMFTNANIDKDSAATPSQFTNAIYGGIGYSFKDWEYPLMLGVGGKYEFAAKNSALEVWQAHIKAGVSF